MLRIRLVISSEHELLPTEYTIIDDRSQGLTYNIKSKKFYFNANVLKATFTGNWTLCTVFTRRKFDLGDCADDAITRIDVGRGGEFYDVKGLDAYTQHSKLYVCQDRRYLTTLSQTDPETYQQGKKRRFPNYLFVSNIDDLKRTVHFELTWSDNYAQTLLYQVGKTIDMEFNIYTEEDEL